MRKPYILITSIIIPIIIFFVLLTVFYGVKEYIVDQYKPEYIQPNSKDSLYMVLLNDADSRDDAMSVAKEVEAFYFITDSVKTILDARISKDLINEIILEKGLSDSIRSTLIALDHSNTIACPSGCLDSIYYKKENWDKVFTQSTPQASRDFLQVRIDRVVNAEKKALQTIQH